jgi:hypothetical protein
MSVSLWLVAEHLGALHGYEKLLVLLIAFGPFVLLSLALRYANRRSAEEDEAAADDVSGRPPTT